MVAEGECEGAGVGGQGSIALGCVWSGVSFLSLLWALRKQAGHFGVYSSLLRDPPGSTKEEISSWDETCEQKQ